MAANKPRWPKCGCAERCDKPKCQTVGSRTLQASKAKPGSSVKAAMLGFAKRKCTPQRLRLVLKLAEDSPTESLIAHRAGISQNLLRYWYMLSKEGHAGDGFDIKLEDGGIERYHILFEDAVAAGLDKVEEVAFQLATGTFQKVLDYQGRVTYKQDLYLLQLGYPEVEAYLLDANGDRIPETKPICDPKMIRWLLEKRRPEVYGKRPSVPPQKQQGGVIVIGNPMTREEYEKKFCGPQPIIDVEFEGLPPDHPPS